MSAPMSDPGAPQSATNMVDEAAARKIQVPGKSIPAFLHQPIPTKHLDIKVRVQPENEEDIDIDILAVPGIGTDPETTWDYTERDPLDKAKVTRKVNWLSDSTMLPATFTHARIMTFGYDSRWFGDAPPKQRLSGIALKVLAELRRKRKNCDRRPILFIGHCYGGLVIQQVYLQSQRLPGDYPGIYDSITGMIFLGTPHHGANMSLGEMYETIRKQALQIEDGLLKTVEHDNTVLVDTVTDFTREVKLRAAGPEIFCFFEERATPVGVPGQKSPRREIVVNESSGTLAGYEKLGLTTDHFNINKFESNEDNHYISVVDELHKMADKAEDLMKQRRAATHGHTSGATSQHIDSAAHKSVPMLPFSVAKGFASRSGILEEIQLHFENSSKVVLVGACGSGKTHVAVEYADHFRKHNPDASIYCVNASNAADFELSYHSINDRLKLKPEKGSNVMRAVRDYLTEESCQWLLIVDGLDERQSSDGADKQTSGLLGHDLDPFQSILDSIPDGNPYGSQVLVTTRSKSIAIRVTTHKYIVELPKSLTKDDALQLLLGGSKSKSSSSSAYQPKIVDALQGSAGALALVRAYKHNSGPEFSWKILWSLIQSSNKDSSGHSLQSTEKFQPAFSIWKPLYDHLNRHHDRAARLLDTLCRLDVQSMPAFLLDGFCDDKSQREEYKKVLRHYDMLEISINKRDVRVTPMIRTLVNSMVSGDSDDATFLDETALHLVCDAFPSPNSQDNNNNWKCRALKPCAFAALRLGFQTPVAKAQLLFKVGAYEQRLGNHDSAVKLLEQCLKACNSGEKRSEDDRKLEKQAETLLENSRKYRLKTPKQQSVEKDESHLTSQLIELPGSKPVESSSTKLISISPKSEVDEVRSMSHAVLGAHRRAGCMEENIMRHKQMLAWYKANLGAKHQDTVRQQFNLALELDANGEQAEAEKMYLDAIKAMESIYGDGSSTNPDLLRMQGTLARIYCEQKRFAEAEAALTKVLEGQTAELGLDHPETLVTRMNMALVAQELRPGDLEAPAVELQNVLGAQRRLLGPTHPATFRTACNLAQNSSLRGRITDAEPLFTYCLEGQVTSLGEKHADTMRTRAIQKELERITELN